MDRREALKLTILGAAGLGMGPKEIKKTVKYHHVVDIPHDKRVHTFPELLGKTVMDSFEESFRIIR